MNRKVRRTLLWALVFSAAVHLALMGYLAFRYLETPEPVRVAAKEQQPAPEPKPATELPETVEPDPDLVRKYLEEEQRYAQYRSDDQKLGELERRVEQLGAISEGQAKAMTSLVESVLGVEQTERAWAPRQDAQGQFDSDSASLYDIRQRQDDSGRTVYERIYVDAAGRSVADVVTESQMSSEDVSAYRVFEMAREHPNMRFLVDAVRRYAAQAPPEDAPSERTE